MEHDNALYIYMTPEYDGEYPKNDGNPVNGDGIIFFDEYRGFIINGTHQRTDPFEMDVFYTRRSATEEGNAIDILPPNAKTIKDSLGYVIHEINQYEYNPIRIVNFKGKRNASGALISKQYCVIFELHGGSHSAGYAAVICDSAGNSLFRGIPKDVAVVKFYYDAYVESLKPNGVPNPALSGGVFKESISTHELGHCLNIDHRQDDNANFTPYHYDKCLMRSAGGFNYKDNWATIKKFRIFCDDSCQKTTRVKAP